ncbi:MAG: trypsin-like peptidase domain-containing protein [Treponema sp.]|nr:trypsin-like peptidase domain-containing protein [Treponema sp.]
MGGGYNNESLKKGLRFSSAPVKDGQEVWSAGFPGLGNEPVWQFGKGVVTNASARIKELIDPSVSVIIQHSAEIDRGNSGGPLLVSTKNNGGYEVVGINTWKAAYRQNTNFAVPASAVLAFIKNFRQTTSQTEEKNVRDCADQFISILNDGDSDFASLVKMISVEMALDAGTQDFIDVLKFAPTSERNIIAAEFEQFPVEGFRCASAYQMWKKFRPEEDENALKIVSSKKESDKYKFTFASDDGSKSAELLWTKENGSWKISSATFNENPVEKKKEKENVKEKSETKQSSLETPSRFDLSAGLLVCLPEKNLGFHLNFDWWQFTYAGFGFMFEHFSFEGKSINIGGVGFTARLPFNISDKMNLGCVGRIGVDAGRYNDWGVLGFFAEAGIEFLYTGTSAKPGLGITFKYSRQNEWFTVGDDEVSFHEGFKILKIYAKIAF